MQLSKGMMEDHGNRGEVISMMGGKLRLCIVDHGIVGDSPQIACLALWA
ncbi:hypothetical protein A2U01_0092781, partial [Trifolium medium]|nr:hypothetical protein [Trifolium medium]